MTLFAALLAVTAVVTATLFHRLVVGRTPYDRLLAAGAIGTNAIVLLAMMGFLFERPDMFVDLALTYALLNFIGTVAVGKYLESRQHQAWAMIQRMEAEEEQERGKP